MTKLNHQMIHRNSTHFKSTICKKKKKKNRYLAFLLGSLHPLITAAFSKTICRHRGSLDRVSCEKVIQKQSVALPHFAQSAKHPINP